MPQTLVLVKNNSNHVQNDNFIHRLNINTDKHAMRMRIVGMKCAGSWTVSTLVLLTINRLID